MFLERFGTPFILGKYSPEHTSQASKIADMITQFQQSSSGLVPEGVEIDLMNVSQAGAESYREAIKLLDMQITIGMEVPALLGFGQQGDLGSFALAKEQNKVFQATIDHHRKKLEDIVNDQIIKRLVDANFAGVKAYPKFSISDLFEEDDVDKVDTFIRLVETGSFKPSEDHIQHALEELGFPTPPLEVIDIAEVEVVEPSKPSSNPKPKEEKPEVNNKLTFKTISQDEKSFVEKSVDFKSIQKTFKDIESKSSSRVSNIMLNAMNELTATLLDKKPLEKNNLKFIEKIRPSRETVGKIQTALERQYFNMAKEGMNDSKEEVKRQMPNTFSIIAEPELTLSQSKKFLKDFAKTKAFEFAGDMSNKLARQVRTVLLEGLRNGKSTKDVIIDVEKVFAPFIEGAIIPSSEAAPFRLETIVRTNTAMFYNQGRIAQMQDLVNKGIVTHYQYSAILDSRTSDICNELHGTIVPASDGEMLTTINPPRHFNCRSILVPVTTGRLDRVQEGISDGSLKEGLNKPNEFYDGFTTKTKRKEP
jgi:SPP1 gp7 family putative phage head morphogenesis protein